MLKKLNQLLGLGNARNLGAPRYVAVADGLVVSEERAQAWFTISTSNTDMVDGEMQDRELQEVIAWAERALADKECQIKILWGKSSGEDYFEEAQDFAKTRGGRNLAAIRAERIDELDLPNRHVLMGIQLSERRPGPAQEALSHASDAILGTGGRSISKRELRYLDTEMRRLAQSFQNSPLRGRPAPVETLAWMIGREQHRLIAVDTPPKEGVISGAKLARLSQGRVVPYPDHLRIYDEKGKVLAYTSVLIMPEFPELTETIGAGEWLRTLADVRRIDEEGEFRSVIVEASIRFNLLSRRESLKRVSETRKAAKEQRKSAEKGSAEETSLEIEQTEQTMAELEVEIKRDGITLVEDYPLLLVTQESPQELDVAVEAVIGHFADLGITVEVAADEQREAWLSTLPCDQVRIPDMGHVRDAAGLFGSWFWGGSEVGDQEGPCMALMTGSTPGLVRNDIAGGSARGDATTTAFIGRSGRGKTTGMILSLLDTVAGGAWAAMLDFKGDCTGAISACEYLELPAKLMKVSEEHSGAADLMRILPPQDAVLQVHGQLMLLTPPHMRAEAEPALLEALQRVAEEQDPSTWKVIQNLRQNTNGFYQALGNTLENYATTPLGSTIAGPPREGQAKFTTDPGLTVVQFPGIDLPGVQATPDEWTSSQRVSVACLRGFLGWVTYTAGNPELRGLPKVVAVPEVHLLTATNDGRAFLDYIARVGRALHASLVIDTQDPESISKLQGLVEQITTVFAFSQYSKPQQDALAELLLMEPSAWTRNMIRTVNLGLDGHIRHGHCIMRDWRGRPATIQFDIPSEEIKRLISTTPDMEVSLEPAADEIEPLEEELQGALA